eukprot:1488551-Pleurochrysis_carterae.AAC.3
MHNPGVQCVMARSRCWLISRESCTVSSPTLVLVLPLSSLPTTYVIHFASLSVKLPYTCQELACTSFATLQCLDIRCKHPVDLHCRPAQQSYVATKSTWHTCRCKHVKAGHTRSYPGMRASGFPHGRSHAGTTVEWKPSKP